MGQDTHILIKISQLKVLKLINEINKLYKTFLATILLHFVTSQVLFLTFNEKNMFTMHLK